MPVPTLLKTILLKTILLEPILMLIPVLTQMLLKILLLVLSFCVQNPLVFSFIIYYRIGDARLKRICLHSWFCCRKLG